MIDIHGKEIRLGNRVDVGSAEKGTVVFSLDTNEFDPDFPAVEWSCLSQGIMLRMDGGALVFLEAPDEHTEIIS